MKKILIYAHYYFPDVASTGQILKELAEGMLDEFKVTVICVVPSYSGVIEKEYKQQNYYVENINGVKLLRVRVPEFKKNDKISRIKNILSYFIRAILITFMIGPQDFVFSISQPPILGGLLGVLGKWIKRAKFIYNIQDFNPEQTIAVEYSKNRLVLKIMMVLDKFSCKHSNLVITVGRDLVQRMDIRFKNRNTPKTIMINNWIDEKNIYPLSSENEKIVTFRKEFGLENKFVIMYSGNIGLYYDLENLIKVLKSFRKGYTHSGIWEEGPKTADGRDVVFAFIGAGSVLDNLVSYVKKHQFENIIFIPYQDKENLIYSLNAGDVHWCINAKGIKGVSVPSKAYGIMAVAKPILGVLEKGTEIRCLIEDTCCGICCDPGEYEKVKENIRWFIKNASTDKIEKMGENGRNYLVNNLSKDEAIRKYKEAILKS
ncbi:glycosyltransferase WbuB [Drancourtella sp. An57]|uniref:glycosyltransferase family 4 protein n=1 Tax=Drancourtella sp. An57 TaxID=1965647 RepID=UPI000B382F13|nr:glycosyltransferase family 4 protein [Drancourtella sp. An57]OUN68402.1 glycosyltransferase WbuB [Drancourtella sp. An57]